MDAPQAFELIPSPARPEESGLSLDEWGALTNAFAALERETFAGSLNRKFGRRMGALASLAPKGASKVVARAVDVSLRMALRTAIGTLGRTSNFANSNRRLRMSAYGHRAAVIVSGAAGGALGLATLPIELPISTTLMFRSIAEIARGEGEDLAMPETALACLEVFALGGASGESWESGYFAVRAALAQALGSATAYLAGRGVLEETAPALVRFLGLVGSRFGAVVGQKAAAQAAPVLGAAGGAAVNYAFMHHFQAMAKAHFTVRRLERRHGPEIIREAYGRLKAAQAGDRAAPIYPRPS